MALWKNDSTIKAVILRATPGSAFCAGGDVRKLYSDRGKIAEQMQFFWHEYRLNLFIHHLGKPYISLMDGATMGGGVGVSLHGSHPVASERFVFAMPETSIGFFPDIGASYLLSRCPGYSGVYLGLTGNRLNAEEAFNAGLVKYIIPSAQMNSVIEQLHEKDLSKDAYSGVEECLNLISLSPESEANCLSDNHKLHKKEQEGIYSNEINAFIDNCFSQPTVEEIIDSLREINSAWAEKTVSILSHKSPLSVKVTLLQLQKAKGLTLEKCLKMDFNLVKHFMCDTDFYEGVRALLIDKDKNPKWNPPDLKQVTDTLLVNYFENNSDELDFTDLI